MSVYEYMFVWKEKKYMFLTLGNIIVSKQVTYLLQTYDFRLKIFIIQRKLVIGCENKI